MPLIARKIIRYSILFMLLLGVIVFAYKIKSILFCFFLAAFIAYLFFRPARFLEKKGIKRPWSILLIYFIVFSVISLGLFLLFPLLSTELLALAQVLPLYAGQMQILVHNVEEMNINHQITDIINNNISHIENFVYEQFNFLLLSVYALLSKVFLIILSPIIAFYLINDWEKLKESFFKLLSPKGRKIADELLTEIDRILISYLQGHLLVASIVGIFSGIAAAVIGVNFPFIVGLIMGLSELVPYLGIIIGCIPVLGIAASESFRSGIYMLIIIIIIQQLESNILSPKIIGDKLRLHPLVIVLALLIGGDLWGIWGIIISIPLIAIIRLTVELSWRL
ncbi:MAG: AI-2E family transporter, partial [Syntrophomonadaceae bacterium]|nr:AI-2E family transporter [Syntrophomonadaceae bacterium]